MTRLVYMPSCSPKPGDKTIRGVALVIANHDKTDHPFSVDVSCLNDGTTLNDALSGNHLTVTNGKAVGTIAARSGALFTAPDAGACAAFDSRPGPAAMTNAPITEVWSVTGGDGAIVVSFPARNAQVAYDVYRSYFPDAGYVKLTSTPITDRKYVDTSVANGVHYYYYLVGHTQTQPATRSGFLSTAPSAPIVKSSIAPADGSAQMNVPLSVKGVAVTATVHFDSSNVQNVQAQVALVDAKALDLPDEPGLWQALAPQSGSGTISFSGLLRATQPGDYAAGCRFSAVSCPTV